MQRASSDVIFESLMEALFSSQSGLGSQFIQIGKGDAGTNLPTRESAPPSSSFAPPHPAPAATLLFAQNHLASSRAQPERVTANSIRETCGLPFDAGKSAVPPSISSSMPAPQLFGGPITSGVNPVSSLPIPALQCYQPSASMPAPLPVHMPTVSSAPAALTGTSRQQHRKSGVTDLTGGVDVGGPAASTGGAAGVVCPKVEDWGEQTTGVGAGTGTNRISAREAQKRFRQRQKERLVVLEQSLKEKLTSHESLATENEELRTRERILEKFIRISDGHIDLLTRRHQATAAASPAVKKEDRNEFTEGEDLHSSTWAIDPQHFALSNSGILSVQSTQLGCFSVTNNSSHLHNNLGGGGGSGLNSHSGSDGSVNDGALGSGAGGSGCYGVPPAEALAEARSLPVHLRPTVSASAVPIVVPRPVAGSAGRGGPSASVLGALDNLSADLAQSLLNVEALERLSCEDMRKIWAAFVREASACLESAEVGGMYSGGSRDTPDLSRLNLATVKIAHIFRHIAVLNPFIKNGLITMDLESGEQVTDYPSNVHWQNVVKAINLTAQQKQEARSLYGVYRQQMSKVLDERHAILLQLGEGVRPLDAGVLTSFHFRGAQASEISLVDLLDANMRKEQRMSLLINTFFMGVLLSTVQLAQLAVHCYPRFPDVLAVMAHSTEIDKKDRV